MKTKTLGVIATGVMSLLVWAVATLKPETFYGTDFSFLEYSLSILANPLLYVAGACLVGLIVLSTSSGKTAIQEISSWKETHEIPSQVWKAGGLSVAVCLALLAWLAYETYALSRNSASFLRDRFFRQYEVDAFSRCRVTGNQGHLTLAKACFASFSKRFDGHYLSEAAVRDINRIDKQLALKQALVNKARASDRTFGPTPLSLHLKTEALRLHPWDSELRNEIQNGLNGHFMKAMARLQQSHEGCTNGEMVPLPAAREGFSLLGYMRDSEIGPVPVGEQTLSARLCSLISPLSRDQMTSRVASIWQRPVVEAMLDRTDQAKLEQQLRTAIGELRYSALKEKLLEGSHRHEVAVDYYQKWIEQEERRLKPVFPEEMIPSPQKVSKNGGLRVPTPPIPVLPPLPPNATPQDDALINGSLIPIVPALDPPPTRVPALSTKDGRRSHRP